MVGLSKGNGHPYSWSAIFNGYDQNENCPFPVITKYLSKEKFPSSFLTHLGKVTHIWTQDKDTSESVSKFAFIENVVDSIEDMIGEVDIVLLARDDAENHYDMAKVFVENDIPIFIDKPLAFSVEDANKIYSIKDESLIYSCSSIRFAKEFQDILDVDHYDFAEVTVMKDWNKYSVHVIEPLIRMFPQRGALISVEQVFSSEDIHIVKVQWENFMAMVRTMGGLSTSIKFNIYGKNDYKEYRFVDTFYAFKSSLEYFIKVVNGNEPNIPKSETLEIIKIIENGK